MTQQTEIQLIGSRHILIIPLLLLLGAAGCREEKKIDVAAGLDPTHMPTMKTENISTLISDSGVVQYKIVAPLWLVYDQVDTPYWRFPKGLYLQKYDPLFNVVATVAADSAIYIRPSKLWKLMGHVEMTKVPKDKFLSERLFWDQDKRRIYSDTFMHIETATHVIEGVGFESNERLTEYRVIRPQGIFPVNRDDIKGGSPAPGAPANPADPSGRALVAAEPASANPSSPAPIPAPAPPAPGNRPQ